MGLFGSSDPAKQEEKAIAKGKSRTLKDRARPDWCPSCVEEKQEAKALKQAEKDLKHAEKAEVKAAKAEHHSHAVSRVL
jgi:hypothetical protein